MPRPAAWAVLSTMLCVACSAQPLNLQPEPEGAGLFVDGRRQVDLEVPFSYYGTVSVDALPPPDDIDLDWQPVRTTAERPEPVTPWIFPLDFAAEIALQLLAPPAAATARVALRKNAPTELGIRPPFVDALRDRAQRARTSR